MDTDANGNHTLSDICIRIFTHNLKGHVFQLKVW
jgi:hypothetical protein